jgi:hypothetical protein
VNDQDDQGKWQTSTRGDAAWKEARASVAARNDTARKAGKQRRETYERERAQARHAAEERRHAQMLKRRTP